MSDTRFLKLTKPWANHPAGTRLAILGPGEDPAPGKVDPARAATLVAQKFAAYDNEKPAPSAKKEA